MLSSTIMTLLIRMAKAGLVVMSVFAVQGCVSAPPTNNNLLPFKVEFPHDEINPGYSFVQEVSGPGVTREIIWTYAGQEDNLYRWNLFLSHSQRDTPWQIQWMTRNGSLVRYTQANNTAKWSPHNCFRKLGECHFSYTDPYGFTNDYVRQGKYDGKQWQYNLYRLEQGERELFTNGIVEFDKNGLELFHEYFTSNNGHQVSRITSIQ